MKVAVVAIEKAFLSRSEDSPDTRMDGAINFPKKDVDRIKGDAAQLRSVTRALNSY